MRRRGWLLMFAGFLAFGSAGVRFAMLPDPVLIRGEIEALSGTSERALALKPESVTAVYSYRPDGTRENYREGVDYHVTDAGIARMPGSAIYDFSTYSVTMNPNGTFTWQDAPRNPPLVLFNQVYVDYTTRRSHDIIPARAPGPIAGRLLIAGDSIAGGAHTVAGVTRLSREDSYGGLIAAQFAGQITVEHSTVDGGGLSGLTANLSTILANPPAIMTVAYGMNNYNAGSAGLASFKAELLSDVTQIKNAGTRVILIGFPRKNPLWEHYQLSDIIAYNAAIEDVARQVGVPFVDIQSAFEEARKVKTTVELFGDNYHHPSNYGQRIYFSQILPHLIAVPMSEANVPAYVRVP